MNANNQEKGHMTLFADDAVEFGERIDFWMDKFFINENGYFNWQSVLAIVGLLGFLWGIYIYVDKRKSKKQKQKIQRQVQKQKKLTTAYIELLKIVSLYPNQTPYDIMSTFSYTPHFHGENFDAVCKILKYQIEDYQRRLSRGGLVYQDEEDFKTEIRNREYYIRETQKIAEQYFEAKEQYEKFSSEDKLIDLYASQEIKNCLVEFEVLINNAFIAGRELKYNDGRDSKLDNVRRKLEYLMRTDIGIF